jgi:hypothetical protein
MFRKVGIVGSGGRRSCRDQGERCDPIGVIERHELADPTARPKAHEMGAAQTEDVEQAHHIRDQITQGIGRSIRIVADGPAGIADVVANDESGAGRETLAELILPREHRVAHQEDRRVGGITKGLGAKVDPVGPDDPAACRH